MRIEEAEEAAQCTGVGCDNLTRLRMASTGAPWCARCMNKTRSKHAPERKAHRGFKKWRRGE